MKISQLEGRRVALWGWGREGRAAYQVLRARLPELPLTLFCRSEEAAEAQGLGLVNRVFATREALHEGVQQIAASIAAKSPLSLRGTKEMLNYARDHSVADSLNYIATWNAAMLMSQDLTEAMAANREKRAPQFKD